MGMSMKAAEELRFAHAYPMSDALALRYQVYCEEFGYLAAGDYPDGLESDEDDASSAHFHFSSPLTADEANPHPHGHVMSRGPLAGYVRLVQPDASGFLPVQRKCSLTLEQHALPDPSATAEVSRLIIAPQFRRARRSRFVDGQSADAQRHDGRERHLPTDILLHLFRQMHDYSRLHGIRYWFAAMERPLARSLAQMGFAFKPAGPEGEFFGRVTPYLADLHDLQHRVEATQPRLADWLLSPARTEAESCADASPAFDRLNWAHRPPPQQLWRAHC